MELSIVSIDVIIIIESLEVNLQSKVFLSSKAHFESFGVFNCTKFIVRKFFFTLNLQYIERPTFIFLLHSQQVRRSLF